MLFLLTGTQLSIGVGTHGPHVAVYIQSQQMVKTCGDLVDGQGLGGSGLDPGNGIHHFHGGVKAGDPLRHLA